MNNKEMSKKTLIEKIIDKAFKRGYEPYGNHSNLQKYSYNYAQVIMNNLSVESIIFSHSFAKAYWGEKRVQRRYSRDNSANCGENRNDYKDYTIKDGWQYHLPQLALAEDRLKYLEKFLDE